MARLHHYFIASTVPADFYFVSLREQNGGGGKVKDGSSLAARGNPRLLIPCVGTFLPSVQTSRSSSQSKNSSRASHIPIGGRTEAGKG